MDLGDLVDACERTLADLMDKHATLVKRTVRASRRDLWVTQSVLQAQHTARAFERRWRKNNTGENEEKYMTAKITD